jgi:hypothetical protein
LVRPDCCCPFQQRTAAAPFSSFPTKYHHTFTCRLLAPDTTCQWQTDTHCTTLTHVVVKVQPHSLPAPNTHPPIHRYTLHNSHTRRCTSAAAFTPRPKHSPPIHRYTLHNSHTRCCTSAAAFTPRPKHSPPIHRYTLHNSHTRCCSSAAAFTPRHIHIPTNTQIHIAQLSHVVVQVQPHSLLATNTHLPVPTSRISNQQFINSTGNMTRVCVCVCLCVCAIPNKFSN